MKSEVGLKERESIEIRRKNGKKKLAVYLERIARPRKMPEKNRNFFSWKRRRAK